MLVITTRFVTEPMIFPPAKPVARGQMESLHAS
jgi:hypothetical protein